MGLTIVPHYATALALLFVLLSVDVIKGRREHGVAIGVSGNSALERRVRVHANFVEYAPFALLLIAMAELRGAPAPVLHALCISLALGRAAHA